MNRQQFNKYLSGVTRPSEHNLNKICEYFGILEGQILLPHHEFSRLIDQQSSLIFEQQFESLFPKNDYDLKRYLGYYFCYFYSLGYPGKIIRSLLHMYPLDGHVFTKSIEHLYDKEQKNPNDKFLNKYTGIVSYSCNRIFIMEREALWGNVFNMTILYPTYQSHIKYLHGLSIGCPTLGRIPSCARTVFDYLGRNIHKRSVLNQCGLYDPDDKRIPRDVVKLIDNKHSLGDFTFRATNPGFRLE